MHTGPIIYKTNQAQSYLDLLQLDKEVYIPIGEIVSIEPLYNNAPILSLGLNFLKEKGVLVDLTDGTFNKLCAVITTKKGYMYISPSNFASLRIAWSLKKRALKEKEKGEYAYE